MRTVIQFNGIDQFAKVLLPNVAPYNNLTEWTIEAELRDVNTAYRTIMFLPMWYLERADWANGLNYSSWFDIRNMPDPSNFKLRMGYDSVSRIVQHETNSFAVSGRNVNWEEVLVSDTFDAAISSDKSVATVDTRGIIRAINPGTAYVALARFGSDNFPVHQTDAVKVVVTSGTQLPSPSPDTEVERIITSESATLKTLFLASQATVIDMNPFVIKQGDVLPVLRVELDHVLLGTEVVQKVMFYARHVESGKVIFGVCTVEDFAQKIVRYEWHPHDTIDTGIYHCEIKVHYKSGQSQTCPSDGYFTIEVQDAISDETRLQTNPVIVIGDDYTGVDAFRLPLTGNLPDMSNRTVHLMATDDRHVASDNCWIVAGDPTQVEIAFDSITTTNLQRGKAHTALLARTAEGKERTIQRIIWKIEER